MEKKIITKKELRSIIREAIEETLSFKIVDYSKDIDVSKWQYIEQHKQEIWDFINNGYKYAGYEKFCGCDSAKSLFKNANLIKIAFCNEEWVAISVYTGYRGGYKNVGITATTDINLRNIGKNAVNEIIKHDITKFDDFYWSECSGSIEHLYEKHHGIKIPNEYVFGIIQRPVVLLEDGFHYEREIKGERQQKIIYGFNNEETFNIVKKEHDEYINSCIQQILNSQINENIEKPSFGHLNKIQCSIAIVNLFIDLRWEEDCFDLSAESLKVLSNHVEYLKTVVDKVPNNKQLIQTIENGEDLLSTMSIMSVHRL